METVKMHISIEIQAEGAIDTGLTVDQWNSLTAAERYEIYMANWEAMIDDHGGVEVLTEGAESL